MLTSGRGEDKVDDDLYGCIFLQFTDEKRVIAKGEMNLAKWESSKSSLGLL
jgi:hypothetical protein